MPAWQPLLDWWFGAAVTAGEVAAQRSGLSFGYRASRMMMLATVSATSASRHWPVACKTGVGVPKGAWRCSCCSTSCRA